MLKTKSHYLLGKYVVNGLGRLEGLRRWAFIFGCVEPDYNYATYLRGSFRKRLFAGHSFENAENYMRKVISRLQGRTMLKWHDYYRMGRLTHYVVDAFTYAHNVNFPGTLPEHRSYELALKKSFGDFLSHRRPNPVHTRKPLFEALSDEHAKYQRLPASPMKDMKYIEMLACLIFSELAVPQT